MRLRSYCGFCAAPLGPVVGAQQDCPGCGEPYFHNAKPCAGVVVRDDEGRVLLGRRGVEPAKGRWNIPGGFCEPAETPDDCAVRELREETGCEIEIVAFLGHVIDRYSEGGDHTLNAIYLAHVRVGEPRASDDLDEVRWFAPDEIPPADRLAFPSTRVALDRASAI